MMITRSRTGRHSRMRKQNERSSVFTFLRILQTVLVFCYNCILFDDTIKYHFYWYIIYNIVVTKIIHPPFNVIVILQSRDIMHGDFGCVFFARLLLSFHSLRSSNWSTLINCIHKLKIIETRHKLSMFVFRFVFAYWSFNVRRYVSVEFPFRGRRSTEQVATVSDSVPRTFNVTYL